VLQEGMKKNIKTLFIALTFLPFIFACSSNTSGLPHSKLCPKNYDPLTVNNDGLYSRKVELKPGQVFSTANEYTYVSSQFYYVDKTTDIKIHFIHTKGIDGKVDVSVECIGGTGYKQNMTPIEVSIPIVTSFIVDANNHTQIKTSTFTFALNPKSEGPVLMKEMTAESKDYVPGDLAQFYPNYPNVDEYFVTLAGGSALNHQLVSYIKSSTRDNKTGVDSQIEFRTLVSISSKN
jgi:hypothetical protein